MDEDVALPRATLVKMIKDNLAGQELRISSEAIDLVVDCCGEFVRMLYTQANEVCTDENKNTIVPDHVLKAVSQLELQEWLEPLEQALAEFKDSNKSVKSSKSVSMTNEEMEDLQEQLFADARARTASLHVIPSMDLGSQPSLEPSAAPPAPGQPGP